MTDETEDHDARARRSLGRADAGDAVNDGLGLSKFGFFTPKLSAVLPLPCEYVIWPESAEVETAMELTVPARLRGGG